MCFSKPKLLYNLSLFFGYVCSAAILFACSSPSIVATQSIHKGDELNNQRRYEEAITPYETFLKQSKSLGIYRNKAMESDVMRKLANAYATSGSYEKSQGYLQQAMAIDSTLSGQGIALIEDYRMLGQLYGYKQNYVACMQYLEKALQKGQVLENSVKTINQQTVSYTHLSLAQAHMALGNYRESLKHARHAFYMFSRLPDGNVGVMETTLVIGIVQRDMGDLEIALENLESSLSMAEKIDYNIARQLQAIGEVYLIRGDIERSIKYRLDAIDEARRANIKPQMIVGYMRLGDLYQQIGNSEKASLYYSEAFRLQQEMNGNSDSGSSSSTAGDKLNYSFHAQSSSRISSGLACLRLGMVSLSQSEIDSAMYWYTTARNLFKDAGNKEGQAKAHIGLADALFEKGSWLECQRSLDTALTQTSQPELHWKIKYRMGMVAEREEKILVARNSYQESLETIRKLRGSLSIEEIKTTFGNSIVEVYDRLIMLIVSHRNEWNDMPLDSANRYAFQLNEEARSRTFLDMLGSKKLKSKNIEDTVMVDKEQLLRLKMSQLAKEIDKTQLDQSYKEELLRQYERSRLEHDRVLTLLKLGRSDYMSLISTEPPPIQEIQNTLDSKSAVVEYWMSDNSLLIWTISNKDVNLDIVEVDRKQLLRTVTAARKSISLKVPEAEQYLNSLYNYLVQPVESHLKKFDKLILIPHRNLHFLPFQALRNNSHKYLIQDWSVSYCPSASVWMYCQEQQTVSGNKLFAAALGNLSIDGTSALPGTRAEIESLSKIYPLNEIQIESEFLETNFKESSLSANYLHIATHGFLNRYQPMYSYLLMGETSDDDGHLTVDEIFGLKLSSRLVTLSACETGLGDLGEGDELVGLSRAFMYAGTPSVIVSLWSVDDTSTAWLMAEFYRMLMSGESASHALTLAQRAFIMNAEQKSTLSAEKKQPYFWASFVLIGNGSVR